MSVLKDLGKGLLARLMAYAVFGLGFWLLLQGFLRPNIPLGIVGGAMIPTGMYLIVLARRGTGLPTGPAVEEEQKEEDTIDPIDGSR